MKKLSLLFTAFILGALISLTIQACGGDHDEVVKIPNDENNSSENDSSDGGTCEKCNCFWGSQKIANYVNYDEEGEESSRGDYTYDSEGREIGCKTMIYQKNLSGNLSGKRYLAYVQEVEYTYSVSNDIQYSKTKSIYYDETGQIMRVDKTSGKRSLYKQ